MEIKISDVIRKKRQELNISQEALGNVFGVTVQAVSKWETGQSYPDITMLPRLSEYFNISLDSLFYGTESQKAETVIEGLPDDNILRVIQCRGKVLLKGERHDKTEKFKLLIPETDDKTLNFEVWGSAEIDGDVSGNVNAGGGVCCGSVGNYVDAGSGVNCSNVGTYVDAGSGVNCGNVGTYVDAGSSVNCGNIGGNVDAGNNISCGDIGGDADAGDKIECCSIKGSANCGGDIIIKSKN